ncbi:hypothetical protein OKW38_000298 [Paraburkholderia sp. MM5496-R1]
MTFQNYVTRPNVRNAQIYVQNDCTGVRPPRDPMEALGRRHGYDGRVVTSPRGLEALSMSMRVLALKNRNAPFRK